MSYIFYYHLPIVLCDSLITLCNEVKYLQTIHPKPEICYLFLSCIHNALKASQDKDNIISVLDNPEARIVLGTSLNPENIREGTDVYFDCIVNAHPPVYKVEWRHNGNILSINVAAGIIITNQSLVLQGVSRKTAGNYTCVGYNTEGDGESMPFFLNVLC
nr:unnamed protein product [Callosobruchus analis]